MKEKFQEVTALTTEKGKKINIISMEYSEDGGSKFLRNTDEN